MKPFRTGLVVGKFAPLHHGHQLLLDEADRACEEVVILSYSKPEFEGYGPARRERWLRRLYPRAKVHVLDDARLAEACDARSVARVELPANDASDDVHRRFVARLLQTVLCIEIDVVFTSEAYGDGFVWVLNDMGVGRSPIVHVEVDRARSRIPVSGTQIRSDIHAHRHYLHPSVYADFVERIAVLGAESTGKTTLVQALPTRLDTCWVPEYGRELWEARDGRLAFPDMLHIAHTQVEREDAAVNDAFRFIVCDTTPLTTLLYAQTMFEHVDPMLVDLADRFYDHVFLCEPDFEFVQDGTRRDAAFQAYQHRWYARELDRRAVSFQRLTDSVQARLGRVVHIVAPPSRK